MGYDAVANDGAAPRDLAKKKRGNRSARLKQCKLDARREQWLSQVKNAKDGRVTVASPSTSEPPLPRRMKEEVEERDDPGLLQELSDFDSPTQSPTSNASGNNTSRKGCPNLSSGSSTWSSSRSVSDAEEETEAREEESGVLDDWEAVADALSINNNDIGHNSGSAGPVEPLASHGLKLVVCTCDSTKLEPIRSNSRAWKPDDVFRPPSLPSISKQASFPASMERRCWAGTTHKAILSLPSECPICYEDLDPTDSSFLPCTCGFRLCLFCHKRILEDDGRCPGCRKQYDVVPNAGMNVSAHETQVSPLRLSRSCSMGSRY